MSFNPVFKLKNDVIVNKLIRCILLPTAAHYLNQSINQ